MTVEPRRSPLDGLDVHREGVRLRELPFPSQVDLRLDPVGTAANRVAQSLGTPLPVVPNTVVVSGDRHTLWLGPDEWLVVGPDGDAPVVVRALREALGTEPGSVVDVSANRVVLELSGARARDVLEQGCSIDLHPRAFGPERCAQTLLARANVLLYQVNEMPTYWVMVRPSFAEYLVSWLLDAARCPRVGADRSGRGTDPSS
ncbi:sarcosine oxidase subunit gamma [Kutzneria viridogrisea]|uniref:Sarcosine oxidase subunit gamma n=2 Tax=Kutzneria TaxID=43356 RepID=W5W5M2_9PSEU|nr:sarcosine oxidase subunit gamma family protein [Kutzneria albida]AHH96528.1 hypothetical protein KALB_3161 [Kutzneria albida DSM 43870]MBA8928254.1 sarcosine oxidase subunit gamma [Kutzneria viridogrisea]